MSTRATKALSTILGVGLIAALLTGCGGRSSSTTGPSGSGGGGGQSTASVQGRVLTTQSGALQQEATVVVVLQAVLGIGVAEAQPAGTPLVGATVTLVPVPGTGTTYTDTMQTDSNGNFVFPNVPPGTYTVTVNGVPVTGPGLPVTVGVGDEGTIVGLVTTTGVNGTVSVVVRDVGDILQNDAQLGHAMNIAKASNRDLLEIVALREQGLGWGEICHRVHVDPRVIGLGRNNLSDGELEQGREHVRNARANGAGKGGNAGGNGKGKGPKS